MFDVIFGKKQSSSFYEFYKRMVKWRESNVYPFSQNLPSSISFPEDFWSDVIDLYKETMKDGLERAISVFWADDELVITSVVRGNETSVSSNHSVNVRYVAHPTKKEYLRKELLVDGSVKKKKDVYFKKVPKKITVEYLFNMHTHPPYSMSDIQKKYSFFSAQDIRSLITSKAIISGLITDRLWLVVRSSDTPSTVDFRDSDISLDFLKEKMKLGVYMAEFKKKAVKQ